MFPLCTSELGHVRQDRPEMKVGISACLDHSRRLGCPVTIGHSLVKESGREWGRAGAGLDLTLLCPHMKEFSSFLPALCGCYT